MSLPHTMKSAYWQVGCILLGSLSLHSDFRVSYT